MIKDFLRMGGWLALILVAIGAIGLWVLVSSGADARAIEATGITTRGRVTNLEEDRRRNGQTYSTEYHATVTYSEADGTEHEKRTFVSGAFFRTLSRGQSIPVTYLPDRPHIVGIEPGGIASNAFYAGLVGGIAGLLGIGLGYLIFGYVKKTNHLRQHGTPAMRKSPRP